MEVEKLHTFESPPTIITQPTNQTVNTGGNVTLTTDVNGTGLSYQWYRNGVAINGATSSTYTITGAHDHRATLGSSDGSANFLKGNLDDLRIYNRDLNATEISALAGFDPNLGLVAYYPFNGNANDEWQWVHGEVIHSINN